MVTLCLMLPPFLGFIRGRRQFAIQYSFDLRKRKPHFVLISGTISMLHGVNQFADTWKVAMTDPATQDVIGVEYRTVQMPEPIG